MEQRKLIKLKDGIKEMTCSEVYEQFKKFIYKTANSFSNSCESLDDLVQIGSIGLIKAFNSYKIESNNNFMTLLATIVTNEFRMKIRKEKNKRIATNEISFEAYITTDANGKSLTLLDTVKDPADCEEIALNNIVTMELKSLINELKPINRDIVESFFLENMNQEQIRKKFNISQSYVSKVLKNSLKTLKSKYERNGYLMTKKEQCFKLFAENDSKTREYVINLAISKLGVTKATAQTYYPAWRNEYKSKPGYVSPAKKEKQEKLKNITENTDIITKTANKITEVADKSQKSEVEGMNIEKIVSDAFAKAKKDFIEKSEVITANAMKLESEKTEKSISEIKENINIVQKEREGINWKAETIKPVEVDEEIFEVTRLIPVIMKGTHGSYHFAKDGVRAVTNEQFISKDKMEEALEAFQIWERCYGGSNAEKNMS